MKLADIIELAESYTRLSDATQQQMRIVLHKGVQRAYDANELNLNALHSMTVSLDEAERRGCHEAAAKAEVIRDFLKRYVKEELGKTFR